MTDTLGRTLGHILGDISVEAFLRDYWQKKPLLIRQAIPDFQCPVEPDELAGLACEAEVESRLVIESENGKPWQLHNGPFPESRFASLPPSHWTLLVQGLDHWVPAVADLLDEFRFIPNWRVDDVMASYAPVGGSVGPHFDDYDVFLLQAEGQRRWQIGGACDFSTPRVEGTPLRIIANFEAESSFLLEPGDMLYLPPRIAHWGIAENDCMTLSVGFRSPSHEDILIGFSDHAAATLESGQRYMDPDLKRPENPGLIDAGVLDKLAGVIRRHLDDPGKLARWFGQSVTAPKDSGVVSAPDEPYTATDLQELVGEGRPLCWNEGSRFAYTEAGEARLLFVDGEQYILRGDARHFAPVLCAGRHPDMHELAQLLQDPTLLDLALHLCNQGSLYVPDDEPDE
ncbi:MAG: transcription factor [Alteromonadaceae bacterium]|nr:transcription factor [Alteromonadaceae bacterium]|tara:strand:+ start:2378 stop:3574 length:1197 start_codon:yes stop_codon:yes gene_type:complete